ncbi:MULTISPECIES: superinfection immunity protein [Paraburkholderia]|uniref:superinfection immunity protein n=1 Tax=Paraburkholderia TaxID=1822464 RepID=UPI0038B9084D
MSVFLVNLLIVAATIYFLPLTVAIKKQSPDVMKIGLFNLLFGWSVVGWVAALLWARHWNTRGLVSRAARKSRRSTVKSAMSSIVTRAKCRDSSKAATAPCYASSNF